MRPPRLTLAAIFFFTAAFLIVLSRRSSQSTPTVTTSSASLPPPRTGIQALFSFRTPFTLFPANAIITLTHDNTTAFLARPAGFGPLLPTTGLKGQVWIGKGFGDAAAGGELGCSDVPGWDDNYAQSAPGISVKSKTVNSKLEAASSRVTPRTARDGPYGDHPTMPGADLADGLNSRVGVDDGTDDYLHHPLPSSQVSRPNERPGVQPTESHADIQSIQEGAEIAGKVVLLSRGGCGFLEKVKWTQRRGGIALIVGDDRKGEPLIAMYARGDTSNISIPSVFTSYMTAHLLSSLVGPDNVLEETAAQDGKEAPRWRQSSKAQKQKQSNPTFTPTTALSKATTTARPALKGRNKKSAKGDDKAQPITTRKPSWFRSLFSGSTGNVRDGSSRPPSSGQLDWILVDEWKDEDEQHPKKISAKPKIKSSPGDTGVSASKSDSGQPAIQDDFVIGVQDWRDPDLRVNPGSEDEQGKAKTLPSPGVAKVTSSTTSALPQATRTSGKKHLGGALQEVSEYHPSLRGGSITPGSGEYPAEGARGNAQSEAGVGSNVESDTKSKGLLTAIFGDDEEDVEFLTPPKSISADAEDGEVDGEYEGLWVTITPTSGASPFFDTLLVLVVSPLVTLTVVYALLLIRSRIRRRRWRAPKSVVERLPVRTYQTIVSPGNQSPRLPSPTSSSVTTPLLQDATMTRPRPRSRTTTGVPEPGDLIRVNSSPLRVPTTSPRAQEHEKNASDSSEWRKHMSKQVECVICLEDYIEGISRVMSLPCGHEFHADCITPWLTTRRRTCPICKGDVVRSLARGSHAAPQYTAYHDDSDDDIQIQAAETINNSSSSALPIEGETDTEEDLEQGSTPRRSNNLVGSWRNMLSTSFGSTSRGPRPQENDRNR